MSQSEILKILEKAKKGMTAHQIAKKISLTYGVVQRQLRILRKWDEVNYALTFKSGVSIRTRPTYYYYAKGMLKKNARGKK